MKGVTQTRERDGREFPSGWRYHNSRLMEKLLEKFQIFWFTYKERKSVGDEMIITVLRTGVSFDLTMILEERPR